MFSICVPTHRFKWYFIDFTPASHNPPNFGDFGGVKCHLMFSTDDWLVTCCWCSCERKRRRNSWSSLSAPIRNLSHCPNAHVSIFHGEKQISWMLPGRTVLSCLTLVPIIGLCGQANKELYVALGDLTICFVRWFYMYWTAKVCSSIAKCSSYLSPNCGYRSPVNGCEGFGFALKQTIHLRTIPAFEWPVPLS